MRYLVSPELTGPDSRTPACLRRKSEGSEAMRETQRQREGREGEGTVGGRKGASALDTVGAGSESLQSESIDSFSFLPI